MVYYRAKLNSTFSLASKVVNLSESETEKSATFSDIPTTNTFESTIRAVAVAVPSGVSYMKAERHNSHNDRSKIKLYPTTFSPEKHLKLHFDTITLLFY